MGNKIAWRAGERAKIIVPAKASRAKPDAERVVHFVASTQDVDRYRTRLIGWELKAFRDCPVFCWQHQSWDAPIGRVIRIGVNKDKQLAADVEYIPGDLIPFAETALQLILGKWMHAVSVGFMPGEVRYDEKERVHILERNELLELSQVTVPGNPNALAQLAAQVPEPHRALLALNSRIADVDGLTLDAWKRRADEWAHDAPVPELERNDPARDAGVCSLVDWLDEDPRGRRYVVITRGELGGDDDAGGDTAEPAAEPATEPAAEPVAEPVEPAAPTADAPSGEEAGRSSSRPPSLAAAAARAVALLAETRAALAAAGLDVEGPAAHETPEAWRARLLEALGATTTGDKSPTTWRRRLAEALEAAAGEDDEATAGERMALADALARAELSDPGRRLAELVGEGEQPAAGDAVAEPVERSSPAEDTDELGDERAGAVLNRQNRQRLRSIRALAQQVLESAGEVEDDDEKAAAASAARAEPEAAAPEPVAAKPAGTRALERIPYSEADGDPHVVARTLARVTGRAVTVEVGPDGSATLSWSSSDETPSDGERSSSSADELAARMLEDTEAAIARMEERMAGVADAISSDFDERLSELETRLARDAGELGRALVAQRRNAGYDKRISDAEAKLTRRKLKAGKPELVQRSQWGRARSR